MENLSEALKGQNIINSIVDLKQKKESIAATINNAKVKAIAGQIENKDRASVNNIMRQANLIPALKSEANFLVFKALGVKRESYKMLGFTDDELVALNAKFSKFNLIIPAVATTLNYKGDLRNPVSTVAASGDGGGGGSSGSANATATTSESRVLSSADINKMPKIDDGKSIIDIIKESVYEAVEESTFGPSAELSLTMTPRDMEKFFGIIAYVGFDPLYLYNIIVKYAREAGLSQKEFEADIMCGDMILGTRGTKIYTQKVMDKTSDEGKKVFSTFIRRYKVHSAVPTAREHVTLARWGIVFAKQMLIITRSQSYRLVVSLPHNLPRIFAFQSFPSLINRNAPSGMELYAAWLDYSTECSMVYQQNRARTKTFDVNAERAKQDQYGQIMLSSNYYKDEYKFGALSVDEYIAISDLLVAAYKDNFILTTDIHLYNHEQLKDIYTTTMGMERESLKRAVEANYIPFRESFLRDMNV